ncbi:MAG: serine/threonine protein kinase [Gemmatimonadales bacterium]|nr:MAG: serine/threonine protein kinase [Gemmatimonadales bacterium]
MTQELIEVLQSALGGRYRVEAQVGRGGMAYVFLAQDLKHDRRVAVKVLRSELASGVVAERFHREIAIAAQLSHPNILPLHDSGEAGELLYYVMPYVEGESLRDRLRREGQLPLEDAVAILREVADALAYAHSLGVVHRDIKPENILLHEGHAVVTDFGVARAVYAGVPSGITTAGVAVGTPAYMSPEQASGDSRIDARSDVYSLAVVFYEMLAGEPPYSGPTPQAILARQLSEEARSLTPLRVVTPALDAVIRKALARSPADRYATTLQFAEAVETALLSGEAPRPPWTRRVLRAKALLPAAAAALLALAWFLGAGRSPPVTSVAVLPFANVGGDTLSRAFVDGTVEILTSKLTELEPYFASPVWVVPASEIRSRRVESVDRARREFGVRLAVTGSVQRQGSDLRITLNLVDASNLRQLRSAVLSGRAADLASWQDGLVAELAGMLELREEAPVRRLANLGATSQPLAFDAYVRGRGYLQGARTQDNLLAAVRLFSQAIEQDSGFALAYAGLAESYWQLYEETGDTSWVRPALETGRLAVERGESVGAVWVTAAMIASGTGRYTEAVGLANRALELDPYSSEAYRLLATAYGRLNRPDQAEATYLRAIQLRPYDWRAYNSFGVFYYQQGRYRDAVRQFRRAAELNPSNARAYANAGGIYFFLEEWREARRMFERALEIQPSAAAYSNLGTLDFYEGRYGRAAENFQHAVELASENYRFWGNLADALYWAPGRREESTAAYRRALALAEAARRINPSDPRILSHVVDYSAMLGQSDTALALLELLLPLMGQDPELMFSVARAYEILHKRERALFWLERALEAGYSRKLVEATPDFTELRRDPAYRSLVRRASTN